MKRKQPRRNTQVHMPGWDDAYEADLSHSCDVTPMCINERRAVCSVLRVVRVHVRDGVHHVVHRIVLKRDIVMREGIRIDVAIIVYCKLFVNMRCRVYSLYTPRR